MMIGYLTVAVAVLGTGYAAYLDVRTTEVPDLVSYVTAGTALVLHAVFSSMQGDVSYLVTAVVTGAGFFVFGAVLYLLGVWGGADAFVMGAMGAALPYLPQGFEPVVQAPWPFQFTLGLNLFILGTVYVLGFAFYRGLRKRAVLERFFEEVRGDWRRIGLIVIAYVALMIALVTVVGGGLVASVWPVLTSYAVLLVGMLVLYRYLRIVEAEAMTHQVDVDTLEEGDVIEESIEVDGEVQRHQSLIGKILERVRGINPVGRLDPYLARLEDSIGYPEIVGLTAEEIERIRETRERVTVRTGVRFVPAFPAAVIVSVMVGDLVYLVMSGLVG